MRVRPSSQCIACGVPLSDPICLWTINDGKVWPMHEDCALRLQYDGGVWYEGFSITTSNQSLDVTVDPGAYTSRSPEDYPNQRAFGEAQTLTCKHEGESLLAIIDDKVRLISNKLSSRNGRKGIPLWVIEVEGDRIMDCHDVRGKSMQEDDLP